jgi:hypothetical protein
VVFDAIREHMTADYADLVAALWGLSDIDDPDMDKDDFPTFVFKGEPPSGRLQAPPITRISI